MRNSLQTRLLLAVSLVAIAAVAAVAIAARQGARREFFRFRELERRTVTDRAGASAATIARRLNDRCCDPDVLREVTAGLRHDEILIVLDGSGRSVVASAGAGLDRVRELEARIEHGVLAIDAVSSRGGGVGRVSLRFRDPGAGLRLTDGRAASAHLITLPPDRDEQPAAQFLGSLDRRLVWVTTLVAILAILATWLVARGTVRPLASLRDATADLARGDLTRRVEPAGADEVQALGRAFNAMAAELERQQGLRRSLVNDVAHELRTPITGMRCRLETLLDGLAPDPGRALRELNEDVLHLGRLVEDLQEVALAEAGELRLSPANVALSDIVGSAAWAAGLEHDARLHIVVPDDLVLYADAMRVRQMLLNLLTNADRHTAPDGAITVNGVAADRLVRVEVRNTGPTLDDETIARLFDRFYRTDEARQRTLGGAGLGLAIVKHLAEAQGGAVWAKRATDGVVVGFSLPRGDGRAPRNERRGHGTDAADQS